MNDNILLDNIKLLDGYKPKVFDNDTNDFVNNIDWSKLNEKEETYLRMMLPNKGVLMLYSPPGLAKSAILRSIADKLNLFFIDLRLSMLDESDTGLYPDKIKYKMSYIDNNGEEINKEETFLTHIIPEWAFFANNPGENYKGTLICFEEINRANLATRNASMQILLERNIGFRGFKFKNNVLMCATGNMGESDKTDVFELDSAQKGRLIRYEHTMSFDEWYDMYAKKNIHPIILNFLMTEKEYYNQNISDDDDEDTVYANPRSWTNYSAFFIENFGKDCSIEKIIKWGRIVGYSYVGVYNQKFLNYCENLDKLTFDDMLNDYSNLREKIYIEEGNTSELLYKLRNLDFEKIVDTPNKLENVKLFLLDLREDKCSAFLIDHLKVKIVSKENSKNFIDIINDKRFENIFNEIENYLKNFFNL